MTAGCAEVAKLKLDTLARKDQKDGKLPGLSRAKREGRQAVQPGLRNVEMISEVRS